ncbi:phage terminase small subunit [Longispora fulva]|uniref:Uncharacterized protein n=1 Tax=Longispora fulva TaxID=619741 RepID=A0A8J7GZ94_9ACTN|nr:hypothetical protein [Longispora fulva]MBG6141121.1 hypothetical protein [Longispora fulva]
MPALPKRNPARRNRSATAATLSAVHDVAAPELPAGRAWHEQTVAWWADIWASPMAPEFDPSDLHGLLALAALVDDFWNADTARERAALAGEIRLQRQCFGLSPIDRRRLQWEIERTDEAVDKGRRRRAADPVPSPPPGPDDDPRALLHAVT